MVLVTGHVRSPVLLSDVERNRQSDKAENVLCLLYWIQKDCVDDAIYSLFVRANKTFEILSPTTDALELHIARENYQASIWIKPEVAILDTEVRPADTIYGKMVLMD